MVISLCKWLLVPVLTFMTLHNRELHPFQVSVTEINHNSAQKSIEISCKMFTDDLENTLNKLYGTHLDLTASKDSAQANKLIGDYIRKHLQIKMDGHAAILRLLGFEREGGAVWSYLEAGAPARIKKVEIINDLLYESFDSQIGIMHVSVNGKRESLKINNPEKKAVFEF